MRKKLYLIDGSNYVYRAFYAIRGLSNSKGFPTNALYGFAQMLLKLLRDERPDYCAVVFDTPEPTFRDEMYADYKANRAAPPDELVEQFPYVIPIAEALGLKVFARPGYEADDLIGTLAQRCASRDCDVVMVSGDKDLMQLVGEGITLLDTMKEKRFDADAVKEKLGVEPGQVADMLGLAGDSSDNVPGLPGVGPKTAAKLIARYGSIENLIAHAGELAHGLREKLEEYRDQVMLSRSLVTIKTDIDFDVALDDLVLASPRNERLYELFKELEFTKLLAGLAPRNQRQDMSCLLVTDTGGLEDVCAQIRAAGRMAVMIETSSASAMRADIVGIALAWGHGNAAYVPVGHVLELGGVQLEESAVLSALGPLVAEPRIGKISHDAKFVREVLARRGHGYRGLVCDTMLAAYLVDPSAQSGLDYLANGYLDRTLMSREEIMGKGAKRRAFAELDLSRAAAFAGEIVDTVYRLGDVLMRRLRDEGLENLYEHLEQPLIDVLADMEIAGIALDVERLRVLSREFAARLEAMAREIYAEAGGPFNINSPRQLGFVLFEKLGLPGAKKTKTGYSTSQEILDELAARHRLPELVIAYRQYAKLKSTYIDALPEMVNPSTGRIHTTFNQTVTATGRLSSSDPNMQNIPIRRREGKLIRACFMPREGCLFVDADYSQIELRVLAHMTGDEALVDAFTKGADVHRATAAGIFGVTPPRVTPEQRDVGKTVNFATIYGQGAFGLARQLGIDVDEAARYIDGYFARYPAVGRYRDRVLAGARERGYVETLFGRRRYLPDISSSNGMLRSVAERMAFNTVIQGTAADIIKRAMLAIHRELAATSAGARMLVQVHDELLFEVPAADADRVSNVIVGRMEGAATLAVPLIVDIGRGKTWADAH